MPMNTNRFTLNSHAVCQIYSVPSIKMKAINTKTNKYCKTYSTINDIESLIYFKWKLWTEFCLQKDMHASLISVFDFVSIVFAGCQLSKFLVIKCCCLEGFKKNK